ncbi:hypothetical protein GBA52_007349 [Prunus armeniaca]|nr:hypothetical protein GBA52_007349 [Prunus armeniaca]
MKIVPVDHRSCAFGSDNLAAVATPYRCGIETPMHPSSTPMRVPRATPIHNG